MSSTTERRDELAAALCEQLLDTRWAVDELRVIVRVVDGLTRGREVYGQLCLANDQRNWMREAAAEARDLIMYRACAQLAELDRDHSETDAAAGDDLAIPVEPTRRLRRSTITIPPLPPVLLTVDDMFDDGGDQ